MIWTFKQLADLFTVPIVLRHRLSSALPKYSISIIKPLILISYSISTLYSSGLVYLTQKVTELKISSSQLNKINVSQSCIVYNYYCYFSQKSVFYGKYSSIQ